MGIQNLLLFIKSAITQTSIIHFRGQRAAIDAMSWLYKGCYSCAHEINQDIHTNDYLYFVQKMVQMLREYNITPILVFDGRKYKAKAKTEELRKQMKIQNLTKAQQSLEKGDLVIANQFFRRALKVTKQMLYTTFDVLREMEVEYIIAPYEADSQIAHLVISGYCDFAITEDSDLVCFMCPRTIFKLTQDGTCFVLEQKEYMESQDKRKEIINQDVRLFFSFKSEQIIECCILSGCDYLPSIKGVGIKKAVEMMNQLRQLKYLVKKLENNQQFKGKIPPKYEQLVQTIRLIYQFQVVYDPFSKRQMHLNQDKFEQFKEELQEQKQNQENETQNEKEFTEYLMEMDQLDEILGEIIPEDKQEAFSKGELDFKTLLPRERPKVNFNQIFKKYHKKKQAEERYYETSVASYLDQQQNKQQQQTPKKDDKSSLQSSGVKAQSTQKEQEEKQDGNLLFVTTKRNSNNVQKSQKDKQTLLDLCAEFIDKGELEFKKVSGLAQIEEMSHDESANSENEQQIPDFDAVPIKYIIQQQNKFSTPTKIRKTVIIEDDEDFKNPFVSVQKPQEIKSQLGTIKAANTYSENKQELSPTAKLLQSVKAKQSQTVISQFIKKTQK